MSQTPSFGNRNADPGPGPGSESRVGTSHCDAFGRKKERKQANSRASTRGYTRARACFCLKECTVYSSDADCNCCSLRDIEIEEPDPSIVWRAVCHHHHHHHRHHHLFVMNCCKFVLQSTIGAVTNVCSRRATFYRRLLQIYRLGLAWLGFLVASRNKRIPKRNLSMLTDSTPWRTVCSSTVSSSSQRMNNYCRQCRRKCKL